MSATDPVRPSESMTWLDLVRAVASSHGALDISDTDADYVLWEYTAFPLASADYVARQLDRYFAGAPELQRPFGTEDEPG